MRDKLGKIIEAISEARIAGDYDEWSKRFKEFLERIAEDEEDNE